MTIKTLEDKIIKTLINIITVEELIDNIKGELKKNDLSKSRKKNKNLKFSSKKTISKR